MQPASKTLLNHQRTLDLSFWLPWCTIVLTGILLRLYLIDDQIILDDEWHSIDFAMNNSLWYLLTHYTRLGATCIPLNLYCRIVQTHFGLSETALLLPSLLAGILSLALFPLFIRKIFNDRVAIFMACLLATSPFLIFFCRDERPYSLYLFFGFLTLLFLYLWISTGRRAYASLYITTGVSAIYVHLLAVVVVLAPLIFLFLLTFIEIQHTRAHEALDLNRVSRSELVKVFLALATALSLLMAYPLLHTITPLSPGQTVYTLHTLTGALSLLGGSTNPVLLIILTSLFVYGCFDLYRLNKLLCTIFFAVCLGYLCALLISTPTLASVPIIMARYVIPIFPACYLIMAIGLSGLMEKLASSRSNPIMTPWLDYGYWLLIPTCMLVPLWLGPLTTTYSLPNNFTNHSAFQESYAPFNWQIPRPSDFYMPFSRPAKSMPLFYQLLVKDHKAKKIIEYPLMVGNHFNPFYYYQHFHKKQVMVGFANSIKLKEKQSKGYILDNYYIDFILGRTPDLTRLKFKNLINVEDIDEIRRSEADYLILHKNIIAEIFPQLPADMQKNLNFGWERYPGVDIVQKIYQTIYGSPQYEDNDIIVYDLTKKS